MPGERDGEPDSKQDAKLRCWQRLKVPKPTVSGGEPDMERPLPEVPVPKTAAHPSTLKVEAKVKKVDDLVLQNVEDKDELAATVAAVEAERQQFAGKALPVHDPADMVR